MKEWDELTEESKKRWNNNAEFWDMHMGEKDNDFHRIIIRPYTEKLLDVKKGDKVLDIGCGNGNFSRRLFNLGADVTAFDYSEVMIGQAIKRAKHQSKDINFRVIDGTKKEELLSLGKNTYNSAVANMVLMDMSEILPLVQSVYELLVDKGTFVFSIMHPCFQAPGTRKVVEEEDIGSNIIIRKSVQISKYIKPESFSGVSIRNQPISTIYFHRPLSKLFKVFFDNGFALDGFEEPTFQENNEKKFELIELPPVIIVRMRKLQNFRGDII